MDFITLDECMHVQVVMKHARCKLSYQVLLEATKLSVTLLVLWSKKTNGLSLGRQD